MSRSNSHLLYWYPRILSIIFALFLSLFTLNVFQEYLGIRATVIALLLHLIPAAAVALALLFAWLWEWIGTIFYTLAAVVYAFKVAPKHPDWVLAISGPLLVMAALFLVAWIGRRAMRPAH